MMCVARLSGVKSGVAHAGEVCNTYDMTQTQTTAPAIRLRGHRLEKISTRPGYTIASCSCGETLSPRGMKGQNGRSVDLGLFTGYAAPQAMRQAHEAHKAAVVAAQQ